MKIKYISFKAQDEDGKKVGVIDIFGVIGESFFAEGNTMEGLKAEIKKAKAEKLIVNISSLGGDAFEGIAIHDLIKSQKIPTEVNIVGATASAAAIISQAGDERNISENALFLIHNSHGLAFGGAEEMKRAASDMELIDKQMTAIFDKATGDKSKSEDIVALMKEDKFIDAEKAEEMGFVDKVVEAADLAASKWDWDAIAKSDKLTDDQKSELIAKYKSEGDEGGEGSEGGDKGSEGNEGDGGSEGGEAGDGSEGGEAEANKKEKKYTRYDSFVDAVKKLNPFGGNPKSDNGQKKEDEPTEEDKKREAEFAKLKEEKEAQARKVAELESKLRAKKQKSTKASGKDDGESNDPPSVHGEDNRSDAEKGWDKNAETLREYEI